MKYKDLIKHLEFNFPRLEKEFLIDLILYIFDYKFNELEFSELELDVIFDILENKKYIIHSC